MVNSGRNRFVCHSKGMLSRATRPKVVHVASSGMRPWRPKGAKNELAYRDPIHAQRQAEPSRAGTLRDLRFVTSGCCPMAGLLSLRC